METGSPIVASGDRAAGYIRSIAELRDADGNSVGWIYLVEHTDKGQAEYVQANGTMNGHDLGYFHIRLTSGSLSSVGRLNGLPGDLKVQKCSISKTN